MWRRGLDVELFHEQGHLLVWAVIALAAIALGLYGSSWAHLLDHIRPSQAAGVPVGWGWWWELVAIGATTAYSIFYYLDVWHLAKVDYKLAQSKRAGPSLSIIVVLAGICVGWTGYALLSAEGPFFRAIPVAAVLFLFFVFDFAGSYCVERGSEAQRRLMAGALYVDLPATIGVIVVATALRGVPKENADPFVSGAIAFQLLAGTTVYALLQARDWGSACYVGVRLERNGKSYIRRSPEEPALMLFLAGAARKLGGSKAGQPGDSNFRRECSALELHLAGKKRAERVGLHTIREVVRDGRISLSLGQLWRLEEDEVQFSWTDDELGVELSAPPASPSPVSKGDGGLATANERKADESPNRPLSQQGAKGRGGKKRKRQRGKK